MIESPSPTDRNEQRLADLELFIRGVVHDLNNALNVMKTNLYLLRQRLPEDEVKISRPLLRINDQVDAIRTLLEGHQALYHASQPVRQRVDLRRLVEQVLQEGHVPEGYRVEVRAEEDLPPAEVDPRLVAAALRALLRNSVRAMSGSGEIQVRLARADGGVELAVADSGPGIPPEILDQAFEPFVSTWPDHAGLGLALVQRVARAHGGRATLYSSPEEGTRVSLFFPQHAE
jgi:signal transduction histidine kinase